MSVISQNLPSADIMHIERSKLLDAFAAVEEQLVRLLTKHACKFGGEPLSHKIKLLRAIKPSPLLSKGNKAKLDELLAELEHLLPVRGDIVHAPLMLANISGECHACFMNARDHGHMARAARIISKSGFETLSRKVTELGRQFTAL